eukprot:TRINITY_DN66923_c14_g1_i1.p1 TRINITY_DN66923_c14_g1~~TRINITY_DN66923_c14_g1_i1.p1  ORF type:complete len:263 (+),score=26.68 TRINITY_DN66923_c14_g1_i1:31-819(+)
MIQGCTAIVTGGSSGIGKAICLHFANEGANVVIADMRDDPREGGEHTFDLIKASHGEDRVLFVKCDVSNWTDMQNAVTQTVAKFGRLDIMVNNAAIGCDKPLLETTEEEWDKVMSVNAKGVFFGCKAAVKQMLDQEPLPKDADDGIKGRLVNISSQHGMVAAPNDIAYGTGKACVVYMTRQIAVDYAKQGIICNAVAPGKILTGKTGSAISEAAMNYSHSRTPFPRLGKPHDVAKAVLFLASSQSSYMSGENLMVDGGFMAF